jgi:hypothetical protein
MDLYHLKTLMLYPGANAALLLLTIRILKQDINFMQHLKPRLVSVSIVGVEEQLLLYILSVCL